ncbi:MAG: amidohydrolase [Deltaproteobacteria bacterium]|nr:amidohydrolase [Deltaproteobacteria bacterium]
MFKCDPDLLKWLIEIRRDFHMHPEIAFHEVRTTDRIVETLQDLGVEVTRFPDMTGAVGIIRGGRKGPCIGLRADIDALPIKELNDVPYASKNEGVMHACGHDAHATILLGVARTLMASESVSEMPGVVKLFFQPAEERVSGARAMIDRGVLQNPTVERVIACHMGPDLSAGQAGITKGRGYASSDRFTLTITGKGAHGGKPDEGIDPIVAGASFVMQVQSIVGRNIKPTDTAVITVGKFVGGDVPNAIPESVILDGTIRALSDETQSFLIQRLREVAAGIEKIFRVICDFDIQEGVPGCCNDEGVAESLLKASGSVLDEENIFSLIPSTGAEDFAYFSMACPSAIMRLGCSNASKGILSPLHSPHFDIDETVLEMGVNIFIKAIGTFLKMSTPG